MKGHPLIPLGVLLDYIGSGISRAFFDGPDGLPVLRSSNLKGGELTLDDVKYWHRKDPGGADLRNVSPRPNDVLVNFVNGSKKELGKAAVYRGAPADCIASTNLFILRTKLGILDHDYLNYFLQSTTYKRWLRRTCGFSGQGSFNREQFCSLQVPTPAISEQHRLVATLNTVDEVLRKLVSLIEAKRTFKQGLARELLTGQRRFPGFQQESWVSAAIGELLEEASRPVQWNDEDPYMLVSVRRRSGGVFFRERKLGADIKVKALFEIQSGDILISTRQVVHGAVARVPAEFNGAHVSGEYMALVPRKGAKILPEYFEQLSMLPRMYHLAFLASYGVDIEKLTFNSDWYLSSKVRVPPTIEEQRRIADTLSVLDREIELLEAQRQQMEAYKRGLLSHLLSGEISGPT